MTTTTTETAHVSYVDRIQGDDHATVLLRTGDGSFVVVEVSISTAKRAGLLVRSTYRAGSGATMAEWLPACGGTVEVRLRRFPSTRTLRALGSKIEATRGVVTRWGTVRGSVNQWDLWLALKGFFKGARRLMSAGAKPAETPRVHLPRARAEDAMMRLPFGDARNAVAALIEACKTDAEYAQARAMAETLLARLG